MDESSKENTHYSTGEDRGNREFYHSIRKPSTLSNFSSGGGGTDGIMRVVSCESALTIPTPRPRPVGRSIGWWVP